LEWAEIDVRRTADGVHILAHDPEITDPSGRVWKIADHTIAELSQLDVGSWFAPRYAGEHPMRLEDALGLFTNRLNLYLNCTEVNPEQLAKEILAAGMEHQVVVYAGLDQLRRVRAASDGKIATMAHWRPTLGTAPWALANHLAAVEIDAPDLTPAIRSAFTAVGVKVEANVLDRWDEPQAWERAIVAGVDWIQTDLPEEVLALALWRRVIRRPVEISLHRGAGRYAPENTLPAFDKAIRLGADYVEFDVRTSRDGQFFLLHDSKLDRTTDGTGPLDQLAGDALRKVSAGVKFGRPFVNVPLPSLDEFLDAVAGRVNLYFDAKAIAPESLAEALQKHGVVARTVVYQSPDFLARLKTIDPRIRGLAPLRRGGDFADLDSKFHPYAVDANWDALSKELIAQCHQAGVRVFSDALGKHEKIEDYSQAMDWGIDLIQTDHPLRVMRAIEIRELQRTNIGAKK
jgi:glycerophosphoryl diester phosphodiesterase